jgi:hypothetical protein
MIKATLHSSASNNLHSKRPALVMKNVIRKVKSALTVQCAKRITLDHYVQFVIKKKAFTLKININV